MDQPITKRCVACDEPKPAPAFFASVFTDDGLTASCKACTFERARADRARRESRREACTITPPSR
jgi:hypothetical protein